MKLSRLFLTVGVLLHLLTALAAQDFSRPGYRGKKDWHKTSARQHKVVEVFAEAWVECLAPHIMSEGKKKLRARIRGTLQNQYSEWAAWNLRENLIELIQRDIRMKRNHFDRGGRRAIIGGAPFPRSLLNELLEKVFVTSGDVLRFNTLYGGGGSLQGLHHQVLTFNDAYIARLEGVIRSDLTKVQKVGAQDLAAHYSHCFLSNLPIEGSKNEKTLRSLVLESFQTTDTKRAVAGVRNKLLGGLRSEFSERFKVKRPSSYIELEGSLEAYSASLVPDHFWGLMASHHEQMMKAPETYREVFKAATCDLAKSGD